MISPLLLVSSPLLLLVLFSDILNFFCFTATALTRTSLFVHTPLVFLWPVSDERRRKITLEERPGMAGAGSGAEFDAMSAGFTDDMLMVDDDG
jgi:hypothetical protein